MYAVDVIAEKVEFLSPLPGNGKPAEHAADKESDDGYYPSDPNEGGDFYAEE